MAVVSERLHPDFRIKRGPDEKEQQVYESYLRYCERIGVPAGPIEVYTGVSREINEFWYLFKER